MKSGIFETAPDADEYTYTYTYTYTYVRMHICTYTYGIFETAPDAGEAAIAAEAEYWGLHVDTLFDLRSPPLQRPPEPVGAQGPGSRVQGEAVGAQTSPAGGAPNAPPAAASAPAQSAQPASAPAQPAQTAQPAQPAQTAHQPTATSASASAKDRGESLIRESLIRESPRARARRIFGEMDSDGSGALSPLELLAYLG